MKCLYLVDHWVRVYRSTRVLIHIFFYMMPLSVVHAESTAPIDTIQSYFSWALTRPASTLPSLREREHLAALVTPELARLLDAARVTQGRCIQSASRGEKPNLLEGDIFVGNVEGAAEAVYRELHQIRGKNMVLVDLFYVDQRWPKGDRRRTVSWRANVTLASLDRQWYVEDVSFARGQSLRATLQSYNDDGARVCITR